MKLETKRAAYIQITLRGDWGYEVCRIERSFTKEPQALPVWGFLIMVLDLSGGFVALLPKDSLILLHTLEFKASFLQREKDECG